MPVSRLKFIFVHGLSGWGSYDGNYRRMPYWGMRGGDLMVFLRDRGFDCAAASVAPSGSAWDRACELYAQLAGTRVDYGEAHSRSFRHERYGRSFEACPLLPSFDGDIRLVLIGHSFGGATVRLFSELMARGDAQERQATVPDSLSPFFAGGMEQRIHSIVTLAAPMNGTTAYDLFEDPAFDPSGIKVPLWSRFLARVMTAGTKPWPDSRDRRDYADFDMHIDRASEMNRAIGTIPHVYYFSVPCSATAPQPDGTHRPVSGIEPLFVMRSCQIGAYAGSSRGGIPLGDEWRENDGLVNTVSATVPSGAPFRQFDSKNAVPGLWNVFPVMRADHMYLQGGLMRKHDVRDFYLELLSLIEGLR